MYTFNSDFSDITAVSFQKGTPPTARAFHKAVNFGNKIIFYGGINDDGALNDYYVYNTSEKSWITNIIDGDIPDKLSYISLNLYDNEALLMFGGFQNET